MLPDNWEVYMTQIDGFATVVRINMDAKRAGLPERFPQCMILSLTVIDKQANGFPSPDELSRLQEIEQIVLEVIGEEGIMPVSMTNEDGIREFIIFTDQPSFLSTRISNRLESLGLTEDLFQLGSPTNSEEPWAWYDFVYPNQRTLTYIQSQKLVAHREKLGDIIEIARPVEHFAYFQTEEDGASFARIAEAEGFTFVSMKPVEEPKNNYHYLVSVQREDKPSYDAMAEAVYKLYDVIHFYQGHYDGWTAPLEKGDSTTN